MKTNSLLFVLFSLLIICICFTKAESLESILEDENWESGYIDVDRPGDNLFYFLVRSTSKNTSAPLIIWLNGGPGCSSMYGLFEENGPFLINRTTFEFQKNPYSWNTIADVLYVDQPVGVGFSTAKDEKSLCEDQVCVTRHFYRFYLLFLQKHPEYIGRDLFIAGESYAGHYIPAIGHHLIKANNAWMNFRGIALGNPFVRMPIQVQAYPLFLLENEIFSFTEFLWAKVMNLICFAAEHFNLPSIYVLGVCDMSFGVSKQRIKNPYDIRENSTYDEMDHALEAQLRNDEIQKLLGVKVKDFTLCNETLMMKFVYDISKSYSSDVEALLEKGIDVMFFFGNKDYVCNWRGGESL